jgi:hypothetical protein
MWYTKLRVMFTTTSLFKTSDGIIHVRVTREALGFKADAVSVEKTDISESLTVIHIPAVQCASEWGNVRMRESGWVGEWVGRRISR